MEKGKGGLELQVFGNRRAVADGCDGIVDYGEGQVVLRAGRLWVKLTGEGLCLERLTSRSAVVEGKILQVEYAYGERG